MHHDNKKVFVKMFKRKLNNEFEFTDSSFLNECDDISKDFDRLILVIYNKFELIDFLKLYKKGVNVLVCVFNKKLYTDLTFLEDFNDLVLLDGSKTRKEIIADLKLNLKSTLSFKDQLSESGFSNSYTKRRQSYKSLRSMIISSVA